MAAHSWDGRLKQKIKKNRTAVARSREDAHRKPLALFWDGAKTQEQQARGKPNGLRACGSSVIESLTVEMVCLSSHILEGYDASPTFSLEK